MLTSEEYFKIRDTLRNEFSLGMEEAKTLIANTEDFAKIGELFKSGTLEQKVDFLLDRVSADLFKKLSGPFVRPAYSRACELLGFLPDAGGELP